MIRLEIKGITVVLESAKLSFDAENPLFKDEALPGIIALPFEVVKTPESQAAFNYWEIPAIRDPEDDFIENCILYFSDNRFYVGVVKILSYSNGAYKITFNAGLANLKVVGLRSLQSLELGGIRSRPLKDWDDFAADCATKDISETDFQFPTFRNEGLYHEFPFENGGNPFPVEYYNYYDDGQYRYVDFGAYKQAGFVPFPYLVYVIKEIFKEAGVQASGDFISDAEIQKLLLYNTQVLDSIDTHNPTPPRTTIPGFSDYMNLQNHVPDIKISEALNAIKDTFNVKYFWNTFNNEVAIESFKSIIENPQYVDWTSKVVSSSGVLARETTALNLSYSDEGNDENKPDEVNNSITTDPDGESFTTAATLIKMSSELDDFFSAKSWLIPHTNQPGNSNVYDPDADELFSAPFGIRLLFWRGFQPDSNGNPYPMASTGDIDFTGSPIAGTNYTLNWNGAKGLYNTWWKRYVEFLSNTRPVNFKIKLTLEDLLKLDMRTKVRIGDSMYFIKRIKFDIGVIIEEADVELYLI